MACKRSAVRSRLAPPKILQAIEKPEALAIQGFVLSVLPRFGVWKAPQRAFLGYSFAKALASFQEILRPWQCMLATASFCGPDFCLMGVDVGCSAGAQIYVQLMVSHIALNRHFRRVCQGSSWRTGARYQLVNKKKWRETWTHYTGRPARLKEI